MANRFFLALTTIIAFSQAGIAYADEEFCKSMYHAISSYTEQHYSMLEKFKERSCPLDKDGLINRKCHELAEKAYKEEVERRYNYSAKHQENLARYYEKECQHSLPIY